MTVTTSGPPDTTHPEPAAASKKAPRHFTLRILMVAVAGAVIVGLGIGYAASLPQQSSLKDARDKARTSLAKANSALAKANGDLAAAAATSRKVTAARDACKTAATDAKDLISQWQNFMSDFETWLSTPAGSGAEASIAAHMNDQANKMGDQSRTVERETTACETAIT